MIVVYGTYTDIPARAFYVAQVCVWFAKKNSMVHSLEVG